MGIDVILFRMIVSLLIAIVIGYEREMSRSNAGIKTHALVCLAATLITITQVRLSLDSINFSLANPELLSLVRVDPARLTAQIITGIGFLGAGTIIVTTRNISGLTTAASIWSVAGLGIAVGMGYLDVATIGFIFLTVVLFFAKRLYSNHFEERIFIEYIGGTQTMMEIENVFDKLRLKSVHRGFTSKPFGNELIYASTFDLTGPKEIDFRDLVSELSNNRNIASVQLTNLNQ